MVSENLLAFKQIFQNPLNTVEHV